MQFVRYCIFSQFESIFFIQFESLCTVFCESECATSLPFSLEDAEGGDEEFPWRKISENLVSRKDVWVTRVLGKRAIEGGLVHVLCCVYHSNPHPWLSSCSHGLTIFSKRKSENVSTLAGYNSGPFDLFKFKNLRLMFSAALAALYSHDWKENSTLWCQGSFALLHCF